MPMNCSTNYIRAWSSERTYEQGLQRSIPLLLSVTNEFLHTKNTHTTSTRIQVTIQMLEIYNEQVRDLFAKNNPSGGLKVRMNPKTGVEVVGISEWPVGRCVHTHVDIRMSVCISVYMYVTHVCMNCMYACMICMYLCMLWQVQMPACVHSCEYVCVCFHRCYANFYICICILAHMHIIRIYREIARTKSCVYVCSQMHMYRR
jgi:hypothetical protein